MTNLSSRPRPRRSRAKWVRFSEAEAAELEKLARHRGSNVSVMVREATLEAFPVLRECDSHEEGSLSVTV